MALVLRSHGFARKRCRVFALAAQSVMSSRTWRPENAAISEAAVGKLYQREANIDSRGNPKGLQTADSINLFKDHHEHGGPCDPGRQHAKYRNQNQAIHEPRQQ